MVSLLVLVVSFLAVFFLVVVLSMYTAEAFDSTSCAPLAGDSERQIVTLAFLLLLLGNCVTVPKKEQVFNWSQKNWSQFSSLPAVDDSTSCATALTCGPVRQSVAAASYSAAVQAWRRCQHSCLLRSSEPVLTREA